MPEDTEIKIRADQRLQEERIAFERDKTAYEQNAQHLRSLNQFLWQVPTIAITLTGGLWYGVTKIDSLLVCKGLLTFAALANFLLIFVLARIRFLFGQYLEAQRGFNPKFEIKREAGPGILPSGTVVICFYVLLFVASAGSGYGACKIQQIKASEQTASKTND